MVYEQVDFNILEECFDSSESSKKGADSLMEKNSFEHMGNSHVEVNTSDKVDNASIVREAINTFASFLPQQISSTVRWTVGISTFFIISASITCNVMMYLQLVKHNETIQETHKLVENVNKRHYELRDLIEDFTAQEGN